MYLQLIKKGKAAWKVKISWPNATGHAILDMVWLCPNQQIQEDQSFPLAPIGRTTKMVNEEDWKC